MAKKTNIDLSKLSEVSSLAAENAENYFKAAETLCKENRGLAYVCLVLSIEESAKARICTIYDMWCAEKNISSKIGRKPGGISITEDTVEKMFWNHNAKHITVLTQTIFALANTFDNKLRERILAALKTGDPTNSQEISLILEVFKNLQSKREQAMYVEADGKGPTDITEEEYKKLYKYAKLAIDRLNTFIAFTFIPYEKIEENVKKMLQNSK